MVVTEVIQLYTIAMRYVSLTLVKDLAGYCGEMRNILVDGPSVQSGGILSALD